VEIRGKREQYKIKREYSNKRENNRILTSEKKVIGYANNGNDT